MTPKRPYTHIIIVAEPLLAFHGLSPLCGIMLNDSIPVWSVYLEFRADVPRPLANKLCPVCHAHHDPPAAAAIPMYEYWIVEKKLWMAYVQARGIELEEEIGVEP